MTTARQIVTDALRKINVLGRGQSLSNEDAQSGLRALNQMLSTWSVEGNLVFVDTRETFPLTASISYTIGSGGDFDTARPTDIVAAYTTQGTTDYTLEEYDVDQYARIDQKSTGNIPEIYYYNADYPLATLFLYPAPTSQSSITLFTRKPLTQFASLDADLVFPAEYEAALVYNLAIWVAGEYEREPRASVVRIANSSKKAVERQNLRNDQNVSQVNTPVPENDTNNYNVYRGW